MLSSKAVYFALFGSLLFFAFPVLAADSIDGSVLDPDSRPVALASVRILSASGLAVAETQTNAEGKFTIQLPARGSFIVTASSGGLSSPRQALDADSTNPLVLTLQLIPRQSEITVTASRGFVEQPSSSASIVDVHDSAEFRTRPLPTIGHALDGDLGVLMQQTSTAQVSPFLRGLTGYQVLNLIDGVRFNNSTFRSGPNQYLAFVEPSQVQRIETALGPSSSQYGSDSLGGTIQVITPEARFDKALHGDLNIYGASADLSGGADGRMAYSSQRFSLLVGASGVRHNDLRAGSGVDSRHVLRRFFGLNGEQISGLTGDRQQDTAFSQWSANTKFAARLGAGQTLSLWYQRSSQYDSRNYKDLWGGLGRLQSALDPQNLNFGYARYEKAGLGWLDTLAATFSVNSQSDGSLRQNLRSTDSITTDKSLVNAYGYSAQGTTHIGRRHAIVFGGEWYDEHISSTRNILNPVTSIRQNARPLYPDGSGYRNGGVFIQDRIEIGSRLLATVGGRWTRVSYSNLADVYGTRASAQDFDDWTFNTSLLWRLNSALSVTGLVGRGFRAPNANDLGAIGINDLGYELPASDAVPAGALLSSSSGENATSLGRPIEKLKAEQLISYEFGLRLKLRKFESRVQFFDSELHDPIVRRTLLFPRDGVPAALSGLPVSVLPATAAQQAQGVVAVATAFDPRAVKAFVNDGRARYYGAEASGKAQIAAHWWAEARYSYIIGRDLNPNRYIRRLPPTQGMIALQYARSRFWWRSYLQLASAQDRLSGGDIDDERIGASRSRADIASVFQSTRLSQFVNQGLFTPTGETLRQVQDRILPGIADSTRVALYNKTAGWLTWNIQGSYSLTERLSATGGVFNILDKNYRVHGSGIDSPGVSAYLGLAYRF